MHRMAAVSFSGSALSVQSLDSAVPSILRVGANIWRLFAIVWHTVSIQETLEKTRLDQEAYCQ